MWCHTHLKFLEVLCNGVLVVVIAGSFKFSCSPKIKLLPLDFTHYSLVLIWQKVLFNTHLGLEK